MRKEDIYPVVRKKGLTLYFDLDRCVVVGTLDPTIALQMVINNLELAFLDDLLDGVSNEIDPHGELVYGEYDQNNTAQFAMWCRNMIHQATSGNALLQEGGGTKPSPTWRFADHYKAKPTVVFY
jgi:hypothetical protein